MKIINSKWLFAFVTASNTSTQCFKTRIGPTGHPGRPEPGIDPGGGKNPLGNWPGKTRSTWQVDPGPGPPDQFFFLILTVIKRRRFCLSEMLKR